MVTSSADVCILAMDGSSVPREGQATLAPKYRDQVEAPATTTWKKGALAVRPRSRSTMMNVGAR
jgi:hypothetical protein